MSQLKRAGRKRTNCLFLCFLFYSGLLQIGWCPSTLGSVICFIESIDSNANLILRHPHRHTQKSYLIWAPSGPVQLTREINHHGVQLQRRKLRIPKTLTVLTVQKGSGMKRKSQGDLPQYLQSLDFSNVNSFANFVSNEKCNLTKSLWKGAQKPIHDRQGQGLHTTLRKWHQAAPFWWWLCKTIQVIKLNRTIHKNMHTRMRAWKHSWNLS